jgi:hypothetical protein
MKTKKLYILLACLFSFYSYGQNTLGTLRNDLASYDGYTFFAPLGSKETYLINNCGEIVHQWSTNGITDSKPVSVYLLENGNILRTGKIPNSSITFGGVTGKVELYDWDNNLLWEYTYSTTEASLNHDIYPLPNGNILMIAATTLTESEAILLGRDPALILEGKVFNQQIIELQPDLINGGGTIVWEWNIKDHLIQNFDSNQANFGVVSDHPELLDFNFLHKELGNANWLHFNSLEYNRDLDQIILSSRLLSEMYIIDHSTTTIEAASHTGGTYGKGGDLLYRWGNPEAYGMGDSNDRTLFSQHYPHWIPDGLVDAGKLLLFNNGPSLRYSTIDIVSPPIVTPGFYLYDAINGYGPASSEWKYQSADPLDFFSTILSSAQRLPNGNTLICDGDSGYFFEIDSSDNIVWEYVNPDTNNGILSQGDTPSANFVFRAHKFPKDFAAFTGKDLTPSAPIELNFNTDSCTTLSTDKFDISTQIQISPNPTSSTVNIRTPLPIDKIEIYDVFGKLIKTKINSKQINIESLIQGVYFAKIYSGSKIGTKKVIKL